MNGQQSLHQTIVGTSRCHDFRNHGGFGYSVPGWTAMNSPGGSH
jgi:hypothetical protein